MIRACRNLGLLVLSAILYTIACPPYDWSAAAWVALTPLFLSLYQSQTWWAAACRGLLFGVFACAGVGYWIYVTTAQYFSLSVPAAVLLTSLNYAYFAGLYTALAAVVINWLLQQPATMLRAISVPAAWVGGELARTHGVAGIPWELFGYTQYRHLELIQVADLTGAYGVSFLLALSSYAVAEVFRSYQLLQKTVVRSQHSVVSGTEQSGLWTLDSGHSSLSLSPRPLTPDKAPWPAFAVLTLTVLCTLLYGMRCLRHYQALSTNYSPGVIVAVVKGHIPNAQRWQRLQQASNLLHYVAVSRQGIKNQQLDLVIWPEFALGFYLDHEPLLQAQLGQFTARVDAPLLVGAPRREVSDTTTRVYNSAYLISRTGEILFTYDKQRLIPFAEYLPPAFLLLRAGRTEGPNDFAPGARATIFSLPGASFGTLICYEVTYPYLVRSLVLKGAHFLVNLSNDTWGANEGAAAQHFSMTVFRAVEYRRALVRAATAGVSGFIDPSGRAHGLVQGPEGVSVDNIRPHQELTMYARYGDWFAFSCVAVVVITLLRGRL
jgi:apolipoprotein N-acyltransferase